MASEKIVRKIFIIGVGAGDPEYITIQAINALNKVDVFFIPDKGLNKAGLNRLREEICRRFVDKKDTRTVTFDMPSRESKSGGYREGVDDWHAKLERSYEGLFLEELAKGECGAFLVWGDPTLYDSTLRIIERIRKKGFEIEYEVIPGISAVQALATQHRVPLNTIAQPVLITTGRRLAEGFPNTMDSIVVMLDGDQAFSRIEREDIDIYWGAYVGTEDQILVSGKLSEVTGDIERIRREAREKHGWIMDTYLLRKHENEAEEE